LRIGIVPFEVMNTFYAKLAKADGERATMFSKEAVGKCVIGCIWITVALCEVIGKQSLY